MEKSVAPMTDNMLATGALKKDSGHGSKSSQPQPQQQQPQQHPLMATLVRQSDVRDADVLCGRGGELYVHPGNEAFRTIVNRKRAEYVIASSQKTKRWIASTVVEAVQVTSGGRFLSKVSETSTQMKRRQRRQKRKAQQAAVRDVDANHHHHHLVPEEIWYVITQDKAHEKACQALRENGPKVKKELLMQQLEKEEQRRRKEETLKLSSQSFKPIVYGDEDSKRILVSTSRTAGVTVARESQVPQSKHTNVRNVHRSEAATSRTLFDTHLLPVLSSRLEHAHNNCVPVPAPQIRRHNCFIPSNEKTISIIHQEPALTLILSPRSESISPCAAITGGDGCPLSSDTTMAAFLKVALLSPRPRPSSESLLNQDGMSPLLFDSTRISMSHNQQEPINHTNISCFENDSHVMQQTRFTGGRDLVNVLSEDSDGIGIHPSDDGPGVVDLLVSRPTKRQHRSSFVVLAAAGSKLSPDGTLGDRANRTRRHSIITTKSSPLSIAPFSPIKFPLSGSSAHHCGPGDGGPSFKVHQEKGERRPLCNDLRYEPPSPAETTTRRIIRRQDLKALVDIPAPRARSMFGFHHHDVDVARGDDDHDCPTENLDHPPPHEEKRVSSRAYRASSSSSSIGPGALSFKAQEAPNNELSSLRRSHSHTHDGRIPALPSPSMFDFHHHHLVAASASRCNHTSTDHNHHRRPLQQHEQEMIAGSQSKEEGASSWTPIGIDIHNNSQRSSEEAEMRHRWQQHAQERHRW
jgi:hypothetical protein